MFSTHYTKMKCGYCGWIMPDDLSELNKHKCFETYNDEVDIIVVDDNKVVTMNTRETTEEQQQQHSSSASKLSTNSSLAALSADTVDELLIETVEQKRPLWDHSQGYKNRSKLKTDALWTEVSNIIGGVKSPAECKKRWGYLRDNYIKARKLMKSYVRSGASAEEGRPVKSGFRFYNRMQFLEAVIQSGPTVSSLPMELLENSDQSSNVSMDGNIGTFRRSQSPDKSNDSNVQPGSSVDDSASSVSYNSFRNDHATKTLDKLKLNLYLTSRNPNQFMIQCTVFAMY